MPRKNADELLYDTEAALRLVDSAISEIGDGPEHEAADLPASPTELGAAVEVLNRGHREIAGVLASLRQSRTQLERLTPGLQLAYACAVIDDAECMLSAVAKLLGRSPHEGPE